ncbi:MAG: class I tRNA ligase family protein, partial [Coriobacteriia bacterium]|nr:class I tRNA ligase family protein [Coriobacteriia bacterium]
TFTCSSWYYLRYCDPHNDTAPFSKDAVDHWMPVDNYIGGIEHAILHLLYSRFWTKVCRDLGLCSIDEPFTNLLCQGMVKDEHGETMSKSKGNVVPPSSVIEPYGADTMRLSILFIAPPEKDFDWDPKAVEGCNRFLKRSWRVACLLAGSAGAAALEAPDAAPAVDVATLDEAGKTLYREIHRTLAQCTRDFDRQQFNTAISAVMELVNAASAYLNATEGPDGPDGAGVCRDANLCALAASDIVRALAPICPHWAEELWHAQLGQSGSVYNAAWPAFDVEAAKADDVEVAVQVSGKLRARISVPRGADRETLEAAGREAVAKWLEGKSVVKVIAVPDKLVNIVAK